MPPQRSAQRQAPHLAERGTSAAPRPAAHEGCGEIAETSLFLPRNGWNVRGRGRGTLILIALVVVLLGPAEYVADRICWWLM